MLEDVYGSIARRWRVLVGVTVLATLAGLALGLLWPDRFTATASVTVEAIATGQQSGDVNMETQRLVAQSTEVLSIASEQLGATSVAALRGELQVNVPRGSQVLEFNVTATSAATAAERANAIAEAYLEHRRVATERRITEASDTLAATAGELSAQAEALAADDPQRVSLEAQIRALQEQRAVLAATSFDVGSLIDPAVEPTDSDTPGLYVFVAAGLFLGVFIGAFAALIRDRVASSRSSRSSRSKRAAPVDDAAHDRDPVGPIRSEPIAFGAFAEYVSVGERRGAADERAVESQAKPRAETTPAEKQPEIPDETPIDAAEAVEFDERTDEPDQAATEPIGDDGAEGESDGDTAGRTTADDDLTDDDLTDDDLSDDDLSDDDLADDDLADDELADDEAPARDAKRPAPSKRNPGALGAVDDKVHGKTWTRTSRGNW